MAREKQDVQSQGYISYIRRYWTKKKKNLPCFSLILCAIFLGCPKTMTENRNHLPGWTLALLETAQSMQRQEGGGLGEPDLFSNYV